MTTDYSPANRYIAIGGNGSPAHFYHANGFPIGVYQQLFRHLQPKLSLYGLPMRPTWPDQPAPAKPLHWQTYIDDLITQIERNHNEPIIGIGHSMGASLTAFAAHQRPELFKGLVLIEPVSVPRWQASLIRHLPFKLTARHPLIRSTLNKRDSWPCAESYVQQLQRQRPFKRIEANTLSAFEQYGVRDNSDNQRELVFGKRWEANNYASVPNTVATLVKLNTPTVALRGKPSMFFGDDIWQQWRKGSSNALFLEDLNYGHLLPLENPQRCAQLIISGLEQLQLN